MTLRWDVLLAILGMALSTYMLRAGGYALLRAFRPPPFVIAMLSHIPGCIFVAFVTPAIVMGGPSAALAAACTMGVMIGTRSYLLAIASGVAVMWLLRGAGL
ncbi:AzlD family protein [Roseococcus sp. YIM B11640]|uniref:AzlD family protein n=1 Tax=Roseococcus sp. YIM B11640 TaxID=3133973 RepID=UPI003C7A4F04